MLVGEERGEDVQPLLTRVLVDTWPESTSGSSFCVLGLPEQHIRRYYL